MCSLEVKKIITILEFLELDDKIKVLKHVIEFYISEVIRINNPDIDLEFKNLEYSDLVRYSVRNLYDKAFNKTI